MSEAPEKKVPQTSETGDIELASKGDQKNDEVTDSEDEEDMSHKEVSVPFFVFLWTFKPWEMYGHLIPLFITHMIIVNAAGVFMCNAGYETITCSPVGLIGFLIGIMGLMKIQMYGDLRITSERMERELNKMKKLMLDYEKENKLLKETLQKLEEQSKALKAESNRLDLFNDRLKITTDDFEDGVQEFRRERIELNRTFMEITEIVGTLEDKEVDLQNRCMMLKKELKKLRAHNHAIAKTYNNLVDEHEGVRQTNKKLAAQIKKFDLMEQNFIAQRNVLKDSMEGNITGLHSMIQNYEIMFLQEIAHNAEFLDGQPGMTPDKFDEFIRRLPANMRVSEDKLLQLFEELANEHSICDHEAINLIISEIVKANAGVPGHLTGEVDEDSKLESAKVDL